MLDSYTLTLPASNLPPHPIADLSRCRGWENVYEINRINVPAAFRHRGFGTEMLGMVLEFAEDHDIILVLSILPSGPLNHDQLRAWYERHGFVWSGVDGMMIWKPERGVMAVKRMSEREDFND